MSCSASTMAFVRLQLLLLLMVNFPGATNAMPFFILSSAKARCVTVTSAGATKLQIDYEAPDLQVSSNTKESNTWITVTPKEPKALSVTSAKELNAHFQSQLHNIKKSATMRERITDTNGRVIYETEENGHVEVCLRASMASNQNPMRFALSIEKASEIYFHDPDDETTNASRHLTHMELEMQHLMLSMKNIIAEADFSKEREAQFHQQTLSMLAASMWWPIVQLCVLLLTGFTQANHIVRYLKTKRLI